MGSCTFAYTHRGRPYSPWHVVVGIPLKTRHREITPGQFEFAPGYGNLIVMQVIDKVVAMHGLATLLQEKPFAGINGLGKHNNWCLSTAATSCPMPSAQPPRRTPRRPPSPCPTPSEWP